MLRRHPFGFTEPEGREKLYLDRLAKSKKFYEESVRANQTHLATRARHAGKTEATSVEENWDFRDSPLTGPQGYFNEKSDWPPSFHGAGGFTAKSFLKHCKDMKDALHGRGKKFLALDLFGQGRACIEAGADKAIATTFLRHDHTNPAIKEINGDGLSADVLQELVKQIRQAKAEGHSLQLIFFRPVSGLSGHETDLYVFHALYDRLRVLYDEMDEGALLFASTVGRGHDTRLLRQLLKLTRNDGILLQPTPADKIVIKKDSDVCAKLPPVSEVIRKFPDILDQLLQLDKLQQ